MKIKDNCFLIFEVNINRLTYVTFIMTAEYDYLLEIFDSCDLRAQIGYTGPTSWIVDIFEEITEINEIFESDTHYAFPLYKLNYFNDVWYNVKSITQAINKDCNG